VKMGAHQLDQEHKSWLKKFALKWAVRIFLMSLLATISLNPLGGGLRQLWPAEAVSVSVTAASDIHAAWVNVSTQAKAMFNLALVHLPAVVSDIIWVMLAVLMLAAVIREISQCVRDIREAPSRFSRRWKRRAYVAMVIALTVTTLYPHLLA
jgi:hypothetical protein